MLWLWIGGSLVATALASWARWMSASATRPGWLRRLPSAIGIAWTASVALAALFALLAWHAVEHADPSERSFLMASRLSHAGLATLSGLALLAGTFVVLLVIWVRRDPRFFTWLLCAGGALGVLDAAALLSAGVAPNTGTLFFGAAGLPIAAWGLWRSRTGHRPLPWPRWLRRTLSIGLLAWVISLGIFAVLLFGASQDESAHPVSAVVVLGAGLAGDRPSQSLLERLDSAAGYLLAHPEIPVVVSGGMGPGETRPEAAVMADILVEKGVDPARILREDRSRSTHENLLLTKALLERILPGREPGLLIVTSGFHVPRAKMLARRLGLEAYGLPAPTPWYQLPNCVVRESFAFAKSWLFD